MTAPIPIDPARILRGHHRAVLRVADDPRPCLYIIDQATGFPILPVRADVFDADDLVLLVPEDADDALQLLVQPTELDPNHGDRCDRYIAYHGAAQGVEGRGRSPRWALLEVIAAKIAGVVDDTACVTNVLRAAEPALCKWLNSTPGAAARLTRGKTTAPPDDLTVVGIDQFGLDVRARGDVVRVEFPHEAVDQASARKMIENLIAR